MGTIAEVSDATFQSDVLENDAPVLVDFWAPWCGPCRAVAGVLEDMVKTRDDLRIVKMNVDDNQQTASRYEVQGLPLLILFRDGQPVTRVTGAKPRRLLEAAIAPALT